MRKLYFYRLGGGVAGVETTMETCFMFSLSLSAEKVYEETRREKRKKIQDER
jgi:hypothetical protein